MMEVFFFNPSWLAVTKSMPTFNPRQNLSWESRECATVITVMLMYLVGHGFLTYFAHHHFSFWRLGRGAVR